MIQTKHVKYQVKVKDENNEVIGQKTILDDVNIDVKKGEFIAILGHNGSGKSTFARHLNALLLPNEGSVFVNGEDTNVVEDLWEIRKQCGMVFQNPDNQIVGVTVEEDVGFGPENLGVPEQDIWHRVEDSLAKVGMLKQRKKSPNHLSGGQKQRVAIASSLAMKPACIVLDEPTAMLDPQGRKEVLNIIRQLNQEEGMTIILITHHMDEAVLADRVIVMDSGRPVLNGTPAEVFSNVEKIRDLKLELPQVMELAYELHKKGRMSHYDVLTVEEFVQAAKRQSESKKEQEICAKAVLESVQEFGQERVNASLTEKQIEPKVVDSFDKAELIRLDDVSCIYEKGTAMEVRALDGISLSIKKNEFIGIMGHTGSGKSTLIQVMNGLIKPNGGKIYFKGADISDKSFKKKDLHFAVGLVFQYPESQLFEETVIKDVMFGPLNKGLSKEEARSVSAQALKRLGLDESYFEKSPFLLSGGEMRRVAIAGVIAMEPEVMILDEPTAGLDPKSRKELLDMLLKLGEEQKKTIIIVSHNMEDIANYVKRLIVIEEGKILWDDTPEHVFANVDELEKIGLAVPQVTYALKRLKEDGYPVQKMALTVEEAVKEILFGLK
ncbi:MAG: energy-coupling factor transporter ATPase [Lachnospiraceae bacterium]|nr:energy-coupling factor transporter ATPase [Lachnospiraceae bacterium]